MSEGLRGGLSEALTGAMIFGLLFAMPGGEPEPEPPTGPHIARMAAPEAAVAPTVRPPVPPEAPPENEPAAVSERVLETTLCGDDRLTARALGALSSVKDPRCGATAGVELQAAAGVRLAPAAVVNCAVARRLADWVEQTLQPSALAYLDAAVVEMAVFDSYSCRPRNNQQGARLSEHGLANAVDIGVFTLDSGDAVTVLEGWKAEPTAVGGAVAAPAASQAEFLRTLWREACGRFGTVLGPESDALHANHLHFDATPRREAYCR